MPLFCKTNIEFPAWRRAPFARLSAADAAPRLLWLKNYCSSLTERLQHNDEPNSYVFGQLVCLMLACSDSADSCKGSTKCGLLQRTYYALTLGEQHAPSLAYLVPQWAFTSSHSCESEAEKTPSKTAALYILIGITTLNNAHDPQTVYSNLVIR